MVRRPFIWAAIAAFFLDQTSKILVYGLIEKGDSVRVIGDVLRFGHVENPAGVFGLSFGPPLVYIVVQLLVTGLVLWFGLKANSSWLTTAFGMILGGALGNLTDRLRLGRVIDFIDVEIRPLHFRWFTFNLADAFLVVGILMVLGFELFSRIRSGRRKSAPTTDRTVQCSK